MPLEPQITVHSPATEPRQTSYADGGAGEEPLFPQVRYADDRERKGFFSLFGRPRQDDPAPIRDYRGDPSPVLQARTAGGAATAPRLEDEPEAADDLEIPSFQRRLAN